MSDEKETVKVEHGPGNFGECLVEGSAEDKKRGRKNKRRAIVISIALQSLGLTALVIAPMLAKPAEPTVVSAMPIPPYSAPHTAHAPTDQPIRHSTRPCIVCPTAPIAPITASFTKTDPEPTGELESLSINSTGPNTGKDGLNIFDSRFQPKRPDEETPHEVVRRIHKTSIDPAMLVNRVEPVFPPILKQLHRNGRVELRALIATDGTIRSLQVVSGDPLCVQSALDAVGQWRYRPTMLNGQPVEVETFITVIYTTQQQ